MEEDTIVARRKYGDTKRGGAIELTHYGDHGDHGDHDDNDDDAGLGISNIPSEEIQPLSSSSHSPTGNDTIHKGRFRRNSLPGMLMVGFGIVFLVVVSVLVLNHLSGGTAGAASTNSNSNTGDYSGSQPASNDAGHETGTNENGGVHEHEHEHEHEQIPMIVSTNSPTKSPTMPPTQLPTKGPTAAPEAATLSPTISPTSTPTFTPTSTSTTEEPTISPTKSLTGVPTVTTKPPTKYPTVSPTTSPTASPTASPTKGVPAPTVPVTLADGIMYDLQSPDPMYHDKTHFTQGLTYSKKSDILFESNGLYSYSSLCRLNPDTGEALLCKSIESNLFAEGMQVYTNSTDNDNDNERLIQITWKARKGFIYDASTLERISEFTFSTTQNEGWGICYDEANNEFIVSDGSNVLHFWDGVTLEEKRRVEVYRHNGNKANSMNELEFVNGKVLANVWYHDVILVIDPVTGVCESEYDFSHLWPKAERRQFGADVLNGISISKDDGILYITGKKWNRMYKLKLRNF